MDASTSACKRERRKLQDGTATTAERPPLLVRRSSRDNLPTPTTTAKDDACCSCWDLHEAAATHGGGEAVRRYLIGGGDPESDQWGNSALHVRSIRTHTRRSFHLKNALSSRKVLRSTS